MPHLAAGCAERVPGPHPRPRIYLHATWLLESSRFPNYGRVFGARSDFSQVRAVAICKCRAFWVTSTTYGILEVESGDSKSCIWASEATGVTGTGTETAAEHHKTVQTSRRRAPGKVAMSMLNKRAPPKTEPHSGEIQPNKTELNRPPHFEKMMNVIANIEYMN